MGQGLLVTRDTGVFLGQRKGLLHWQLPQLKGMQEPSPTREARTPGGSSGEAHADVTARFGRPENTTAWHMINNPCCVAICGPAR